MSQKFSGFTLVELLVATAVSLFLLLAFIEIYLTTKCNYQFQQAMAHLQERGRFAQRVLTTDIRLAGYIGCAHLDKNFALANPVNYPVLPFLHGNDLKIAGAVSDTLTVVRRDMQGVPFKPLNEQAIEINPALPLNNHDLLLISDCRHAALVRVAQMHHNANLQANLTTKIVADYASYAEIGKFLMHTYYVADTGRVNHALRPIRALYRQDLDQQKAEVIEGVEDMQIRYGVANPLPHQAIAYLPAAAIRDWSLVKAVKIDLLLDSLDDILPKPAPYAFRGKQYVAIDRKFRQQWSMTVALRMSEAGLGSTLA